MEEGQSRRSVVVGPGNAVVVTPGVLVGDLVTEPAEDEALAGDVVVRLVPEPCTEAEDDDKAAPLATFLFLAARLAPTPPPTAAPVITIAAITAISVQKVPTARPQIARFEGSSSGLTSRSVW